MSILAEVLEHLSGGKPIVDEDRGLPDVGQLKRDIKAMFESETHRRHGRNREIMEAVAMAAIVMNWPDLDVAAQWVSYRRPFIDQVHAKMARAEFFTADGKVRISEWGDEKTGGVSFILDCLRKDGIITMVKPDV